MTTHPIQLTVLYERLAKERLSSNSFRFEFSKYVYIPQAISEKRDVFESPTGSVQEIFEREKNRLGANEEIAFHSRILGTGSILHIPFFDMGCAKIEPHLDNLREAFGDFGVNHFSVFHSGRSFHIYGHSLLDDEKTLIRFIGRLLLLNLPNQERVIDERWVGHRLMAGYLTLRWTNNNPHYKSTPTAYLEV